MKKWNVALLFLTALTTLFVACKKENTGDPVTISLWTKEGAAEGSIQWVTTMADEFSAVHENVKIDVLLKDAKALREDFQTAALAGTSPDLLWSVSDHAGSFITSGLIQPVDKYIETSHYAKSIVMNGETWAVPISTGNHLMLMVNKQYVSHFPQNTDDFIAMAKSLTTGDKYGLSFNQNDASWLIPWLGGFGGTIFDTDGVTPTLDTDAMVNTLTFLSDLKFKHNVIPPKADYTLADTLFKEGKSAMLINGDWSIASYKEVLGDDLLIGRLPKISATGKWPAPYISGTYFFIPTELPTEKEAAVYAFIAYVTSDVQQKAQIEFMYRLPGLKSALSAPSLTSDTLLLGSLAQWEVGTPVPIGNEMGAVHDAMDKGFSAVIDGSSTPQEAAKMMQETAISAIANSQ